MLSVTPLPTCHSDAARPEQREASARRNLLWPRLMWDLVPGAPFLACPLRKKWDFRQSEVVGMEILTCHPEGARPLRDRRTCVLLSAVLSAALRPTCHSDAARPEQREASARRNLLWPRLMWDLVPGAPFLARPLREKWGFRFVILKARAFCATEGPVYCFRARCLWAPPSQLVIPTPHHPCNARRAQGGTCFGRGSCGTSCRVPHFSRVLCARSGIFDRAKS